MPFEIQFLKKIDTALAGFVALLVMAIAGMVTMSWHLGTLRTGLEEARERLEDKQLDADRVVRPTQEETGAWESTENLLVSRLITDNEIPPFIGQVSDLAASFQVAPIGVDTAEREVQEEGADAPTSDQLARAVGIQRYTELTLTFSGEYENAARFIQSVGRLPNLTEFTSVTLTRSPPEIDVRLVLRVYKRESDA